MGPWEYVHDKVAGPECEAVNQTLMRYFGVYDAQHTRDGSMPWSFEKKR